MLAATMATVVRHISFVRFIVDLLSIFFLLLAIVLVMTLISPQDRGILCSDYSARLPKSAEETVPGWMLFASTIVVDVLIVMVELGRFWHECNYETQYEHLPDYIFAGTFSIHRVIVRIYRYFGFFWFGLGAVSLTTEILKRFFGELRPYFWFVCVPKMLNCTHPYDFVFPIPCTGSNIDAIIKARQSFPSGHSSMSFYQAVFAVLYLEGRIFNKHIVGHFIIPCLQFGLLLSASFVASSRVTDHYHYFKDIAFGTLLGIGFAIAFCCWAKVFDKRELPSRNQEKQSNNSYNMVLESNTSI